MIKKIISLSLSLLLTLAISSSALAHPGRTDSQGGHEVGAEGWGHEIGTYHLHDKYDNIVPVDKKTLTPAEISVTVDGQKIAFDQKPVNTNGRVLVPISAVVQQMGCSVAWDSETQTVYINTPDCALEKTAVKGDNINVYVDNLPVEFPDQPPVNINSRILIPVKYVSEKLNYSLDWDGKLQCVYIVKNETPVTP